jgi:hypothetical protein
MEETKTNRNMKKDLTAIQNLMKGKLQLIVLDKWGNYHLHDAKSELRKQKIMRLYEISKQLG